MGKQKCRCRELLPCTLLPRTLFTNLWPHLSRLGLGGPCSLDVASQIGAPMTLRQALAADFLSVESRAESAAKAWRRFIGASS